jgi:hypothetical protein
MTMEEALAQLFQSDAFKEKAAVQDTKGSSLRIYHKRYREGKLSSTSAKNLLVKFGYEETWTKKRKK